MLQKLRSFHCLFLLVFACGPLEPYDKEKIENSKVMDEDAIGETPKQEPTPKNADPANSSDPKVVVDADGEGTCQENLLLTQKTALTYEFRTLSQNPLNLQQTSNHSFDKYWQDFKVLASEGYQSYNDAGSYGVNVISQDLSPGAWYWRVLGVHHLLPYENRSKHHAFVEVLDKDGKQIRDNNLYAKLFATPSGNEGELLRLDKPFNEPAGNQAMYKNGRLAVGIDRAANFTDLPTERVAGMHTEHADEPLPDGNYNTFGHHSYYSVFQLTQKPLRQIKILVDDKVDFATEAMQLKRMNGAALPIRKQDNALFVENLNEEKYVLAIGELTFPVNFEKKSRTLELTLKEGANCP